MSLGPFFRRLKALIYKNFLVTVVRSPISFFLFICGIPIAVLAVLLSIPDFVSSKSHHGASEPAALPNLADVVDKKLVIVQPPHLGPDVKRVVDEFTKDIDSRLLQYEDAIGSVANLCVSNLRGVSPCYGSVIFSDSPGTTKKVPDEYSMVYLEDEKKNHTWSYGILVDPSKTSGTFDADTHNNKAEQYQLPLQLAIDQAITNITKAPDVFTFTETTQAEKEKIEQKEAANLISGTYVFALFVCYLFIVYRQTSFITGERESGMSQLVDSMGGGSTAAGRVLGWLITFNLYGLPIFIIFGVLHQQILFPSSSAGAMIGWQILTGMAVNSSCVFAAAFFHKSRVSSIYVIGGFLLTAVGAQVLSFESKPPPGPAGAYVLAFLFPSSNFVLFTVQMCLWQVLGKSVDFSIQPIVPKDTGALVQVASYKITTGEMLGFLAVQIIVYPLLAILVEKLMHGIDFRSREFTGENTSGQDAVAETFELKKQFTPNIFERIFCCGRRKTVKAVDGVSFQGHKGEILCLVGPNGSGKTTTLHMMSGFIKPTSGNVKLGISPSQIGICPQRNTLWDELTVDEHIYMWSQIKASDETKDDMAQLAASCDLEAKQGSKSKTLSGGQKRKLQLACMFVGGSSVCLIDECTSGLDPLSRRVIWEILLEQRAKRSIVFTTHFLDEVDVLADNIVILTKGKVNCHGAAAELKNLYGRGYRVDVPREAASKVNVQQYPSTFHQDRVIYMTPDSQSAAQLSGEFSSAGVTEIGIAGPQVEDVFLRVADDGILEPKKTVDSGDGPGQHPDPEFELEPARVLSFGAQLWVLFRKRITILKRFWFPYFWVLALPIIITPQLYGLVDDFKPGGCENLQPYVYMPYQTSITFNPDYCEGIYGDSVSYGCASFSLAPKKANDTLYDILMEGFHDLANIDNQSYYEAVKVYNNPDAMRDGAIAMRDRAVGAVYLATGDETPVVGFSMDDTGQGSKAVTMLSIWAQMESDTEIITAVGSFSQSTGAIAFDATLYAVFFTLIHAIWPAAMVLYPAIEKARKVRALEYANGVRRAPMWLAYGLFDTIFVLIIAIACSVTLTMQLTYWNGPGIIMLPILFLYGMAGILLGYVIAHFCTGALKTFMATMGVNLLMFAISAIAFSVGSGFSGPESVDTVTNGITFGLNLVLPIGNVFRALLLGGNVARTGCRDGAFTPPGSIYAYGGPILYLCIQVIVLAILIIWIEGDMAFFRRKGSKAVASAAWKDSEKSGVAKSAEVEAEKLRVEQSESDFLRILNLDKSFGSNHAVQDVSVGLPQSDVTALLGPNGAGKSTLVNMIQSELSADHGKILLKGEDSRTRSAQRYLGVCPQFDALDMMNTKEHLEFYARVKGIQDVKGNVMHIMNRLDLTPHAKTNASKLSGGNKRKLSLAIALMGAPPVMVLDEPTSAMDAVAKRSFWRLIQDITPGRSVLLTTHSMEEADTLATRVAIIAGRLLAVGTTGALREKYSNVYYVNLLLKSAPNSSQEEMSSIRAWVNDRIPGAQLERAMLGGQVRFTIPGNDGQGRSPVAATIELLEREKDNVGVEYYSIGGATLERVFLNVARENNTQEEDGVQRKNIFKRMFRR